MRGSLNTEPTPGLIFVLTGPSGVGKTTLYRKLLERHSKLKRVITTTSRPMRPGEIEGQDYYFISPEAFEKQIQAQAFYEYACVYGEWKGVYKKVFIDTLTTGFDILLSVDVQGALSYKKLRDQEPNFADRLITTFITPKNIEILRERLAERGDAQTLTHRIQEAQNEIKQANNFDYVITSATPEEDLRQIEALYYKSKIFQIKQHQLALLNNKLNPPLES